MKLCEGIFLDIYLEGDKIKFKFKVFGLKVQDFFKEELYNVMCCQLFDSSFQVRMGNKLKFYFQLDFCVQVCV